MTDQQTLEDLNLIGKYKKNSIFSFFNHTQTLGGERILEEWFRNPMSDKVEIEARSNQISFFRNTDLTWAFNTDELDLAKTFIVDYASGSSPHSIALAMRNRGLSLLGMKEEEIRFTQGAQALVQVLIQTRTFLQKIHALDKEGLFQKTLLDLPWLKNNQLKHFLTRHSDNKSRLSLSAIVDLDRHLHHTWRQEISNVIDLIYYLDAIISVASTADKHGFVQAKVLDAGQQHIHIQQVVHPTLTRAIGNDIDFTSGQNLIFLTGANMAGKSTYMKSFAIAIYLAHMGFPVAATFMEFSVRDGIYTSINVSDDISKGYSHYYAEVQRVKQVAEAVCTGQNLIVIFDELFKGTNVKDAYEATLAVTKAFQLHTNCQYIISTHITEVGEELRTIDSSSIRFNYMPTVMDGLKPSYTYIARNGISADKYGMLIIQNEGILDLLKTSKIKSLSTMKIN